MINRRALFTNAVTSFVLNEAVEMLTKPSFQDHRPDQVYDVFRIMPPACQVGGPPWPLTRLSFCCTPLYL